MFRDPVELALQAIEQVIVLGQPVSGARVEDELGRDAAVFQGAIELHRLADRDAFIGRAVQNQCRCRNLASVREG